MFIRVARRDDRKVTDLPELGVIGEDDKLSRMPIMARSAWMTSLSSLVREVSAFGFTAASQPIGNSADSVRKTPTCRLRPAPITGA